MADTEGERMVTDAIRAVGESEIQRRYTALLAALAELEQKLRSQAHHPTCAVGPVETYWANRIAALRQAHAPR